FYFRFFFQAEDGIRDRNVTGVQTCALPIYRGSSPPPRPRLATRSTSTSSSPCYDTDSQILRLCGQFPLSPVRPAPLRWWRTALRSEERRVGKECRSGVAP